MFLNEDVLDLDPTSDAWEDFVVWIKGMAFFLESFQSEGVELGIRLAAWMNEEVDAVEDVDLTISISPDYETDSEVSGSASWNCVLWRGVKTHARILTFGITALHNSPANDAPIVRISGYNTRKQEIPLETMVPLLSIVRTAETRR